MAVYKDDKKGTWYVKCRVNGKHTTCRGYKSKKEALKGEIELKDSILSPKTLNDLANEYINSLSTHKNSSAYSVECVYRTHIRPLLGHKKISSIVLLDMRKLQASMINKTYGKNKHYSNRTINQVTGTLTSILNYAVGYEYIIKNPCRNFKTLKEIKLHEELLFWTNLEFEKAIQYEPDFMMYCYLVVSYLTGMRKGEMRALKWIDIDFEQNIININRHTIDKVRVEDEKRVGKVTVGRKNGASHIVAMDTNIKCLLQRLKTYDKLFDGWQENSYLFGIYKPIGQNTPNRHLTAIAKEAGLNPITIHGLRHSHVSYLISKKLSVYEIAQRIGDTVEMVLNVYGHMFPNPQKNIVNVLNSDFNFIQDIHKNINVGHDVGQEHSEHEKKSINKDSFHTMVRMTGIEPARRSTRS